MLAAARPGIRQNAGVTFTDNFNRADDAATAGPDWTCGGNGLPTSTLIKVGIASNKLKPVNSNGGYEAYAYANRASGATFDVQVVTSTLGLYKQIIAARINPADGTHLILLYNQLVYSNPTFTTDVVSNFGSDLGVSFADGDTARLTGSGTTLKVYKNGALVTTVTSSSNATTGVYHGVSFNTVDPLQRWDDFTVTVRP